MAHYFDFHYHPMFKKFLSEFETSYPSKREPDDLIPDIVLQDGLLNFIDRKALHFLGSQVSFDQLFASKGSIGVANIVSIEYAIASAKNIFGDVLRSNIVAPLDKTYFHKIGDGDISYYQVFIKELNLYSILANIGSSKQPGRKALINILARSKNDSIKFSDYTGATFALAMEGGHNLNRNMINNIGKPDTIADPGVADAIYTDFYTNCNTPLSPAQSLTKLFQAMWKEEMDLLYVTLTHLTYISEQPLATHAYGMKILVHDYFYPTGNGLTDKGREVISAAYEMTVDGRKTPVLIDVKHMSLKSRLDFYAYRKEKGYTLPILATHMGVTGWSISKWINADARERNGRMEVEAPLLPVGIENSADVNFTKYFFNPWTINLMDDDIIEILNSKGMIGVSLDKRIIGALATDKNLNYTTTEYLSTAEYNYLKSKYKATPYDAEPDRDPESDLDTDPDRDLNDWNRVFRCEVACLAFNIIHIIAVGLSNNVPVDPWSHIVIGSDYDGLIEPLTLADYFSDLDKYGMEEILWTLFPGVESTYLHYHPHFNGTILPSTPKGDVDMKALKIKVRGIMYQNGADFMEQWYTDKL